MNKSKRVVSIILASFISFTPAFAMHGQNAQPGFSGETCDEVKELRKKLEDAESQIKDLSEMYLSVSQRASTLQEDLQRERKLKSELTGKHRTLMGERLQELKKAKEETEKLRKMLEKPPYEASAEKELQKLRQKIEAYQAMESAYFYAQDEVDRISERCERMESACRLAQSEAARMSERLRDYERSFREQERTIADLIAQIEQLSTRPTETKPTDEYTAYILHTMDPEPMLKSLADKLLSEGKANRFLDKCAKALPRELGEGLTTNRGKLIIFLRDVLRRGLKDIVEGYNRGLAPSAQLSVNDSAGPLLKAIACVKQSIPTDSGNNFKLFLDILSAKLAADGIKPQDFLG